MREHKPVDFALTAIVAHELFYGACKERPAVETLTRIAALQFEVVDFNREEARRPGELRAVLAAASISIGPYDAMTAGQAWLSWSPRSDPSR
ncbi:MAG TPA: hypothetical protein PK177_02080 [Burkholderiaceae bacterium]|nr:hypothetical protein [Burkholderiaceae bacterium]